jgi:GNAT superfamily N-acetyltransferase
VTATPTLPASPIAGLTVVGLGPESEPILQRFFDANPAYFVTVSGEPAGPNEARDEIRDEVPAGMSYTSRWMLGWADAGGELAAMADGVCDLLAPGVWHIGLFIVATSRHGGGDARTLYRSLEDWALANGAAWMRLGVVQGNVRAERFWQAQGYVETRTRTVAMGRRTNVVRVMHKPLAGGSVAQYLALVPRDRPGA